MAETQAGDAVPEGYIRQPVVPLSGDAAKRYADLASVQQDLLFVVRCCEEMADAVELAERAEATLLEALWTEALVAYSRAFASGKRLGLHESVFDTLPPEALEAHRYYRDMRDKRVAHSVNLFEQVQAVAILAPDKSSIDGVGCMTMRHIGPVEEGAAALSNLVRLLQGPLGVLARDAEASFHAEAESIDVATLAAMPEAQMVTPAPSDVARGRN